MRESEPEALSRRCKGSPRPERDPGLVPVLLEPIGLYSAVYRLGLVCTCWLALTADPQTPSPDARPDA